MKKVDWKPVSHFELPTQNSLSNENKIVKIYEKMKFMC